VSPAPKPVQLKDYSLTTLSQGFSANYSFYFEASPALTIPQSISLLFCIALPSRFSPNPVFVLDTAGYTLEGRYSSFLGLHYANVTLPANLVLSTFTLSIYPLLNPLTTAVGLGEFSFWIMDAVRSLVFLSSVNDNPDQAISFTVLKKVAVLGPTLAQAGQTIQLSIVPDSRPADLTIIPITTSDGITFSPPRLTFKDFAQANLTLNVIISAAFSGTVTIAFNANQPAPQSFSPPQAFALTVSSFRSRSFQL
jgi:hypothetical protein